MKHADNAAGFNILVGADVTVGGVPFAMAYQGGQKDAVLRLEWKPGNDNAGMELDDLAAAFDDSPVNFPIPESIADFDLALSRIALAYGFKTGTFSFTVEADKYGSLVISSRPDASGRVIRFALCLDAKFMLSNLPVLSDGVGKNDYVALKEFSVEIARGGKKITPRAAIDMVLMGNSNTFVAPPEDAAPVALHADADADEPANPVKWLDVNKTLGPLRLSRLGFELGKGSVTLHLDAGVKLSALLLEFLDLHLLIPLKAGEKVAFGLSGLAVTLSRPPLYISGGLYLSDTPGIRLYTGELSVGFKAFQLTALASYGQFEDGPSSFFAFLMLAFSFGGPPMFFVTGLAGGFGYNRNVTLPAKVQDVASFPFVAAAMGKGELKPGMSPGEVLVAMNRWIAPKQGQYFASAGVRFTSFGMVESFVLLNVLFGNRFELSLLGLSKLSLPSGAKNPIAYAELALKVVIAPNDGLISVEGALTSASYLLSRDCKLRGGFAFFVWFGDNDHAGDFVVTLGGYRDDFHVQHYPVVDRIGVDWKIDKHLTMTAGFYFALTPSCVMMGGNLAVTYENGRLKAWFRAWADFFMRWKPFEYAVSIGVSIGASYRWDFFPFYTTFTVELGASLDLWGPPFGGKVHVSWFVISFTIHIGSKHTKPEPVNWDNFASAFLPAAGAANDNATERAILSVKATSGVVREAKAGRPHRLAAEHMAVEVVSPIPCTRIIVDGTPVATCGDMGILPMGISAFTSDMTVKVSRKGAKNAGAGGLTWSPVRSNVPRALWDKAAPAAGDNDTLKRGVPTGVKLSAALRPPEGVLPKQGSYPMKTLCENESLEPLAWKWTAPGEIKPKDYSRDDAMQRIRESIVAGGGKRKKLLDTLADEFGVCREEELRLDAWALEPEQILVDVPTLRRLGAEALPAKEPS